MRGEQLAALVRPHLAGRVEIRVLPFDARAMPPSMLRVLATLIPAGAVVMFVKFAAKGVTRAHLAALRRRASVIGLDSIDMALDTIPFDLFDFHVAASISGQGALAARLAALGLGSVPVELLHHHGDPRLDRVEIPEPRPFRCGYAGALKNAAVPPGLDGEVTVLPVNYARDMERVIPRLGRFPLHFAVRPENALTASESREYKPFTKGFTAARCRANILVNRGADDAEALLGPDYPFLVENSDPASVIAGHERAREAYGGPLWADGLERLRAMDDLVTPPALARQLEQILDRVTV